MKWLMGGGGLFQTLALFDVAHRYQTARANRSYAANSLGQHFKPFSAGSPLTIRIR